MQNQAGWAATIDAAIASFEAAPLGEVQSFCAGVRAKVDAFESRRLAAEMADGDDERPVRRKAAAGGARSRAAARRAAKRAAAVKKNPGLADDMESGKLSSEQADTIADAASKSDGAAACDQGLIDAVAGAGVDAGRRIASDWLQRRADKDKVESKHQRQQRRRRMSSYVDPHRETDVLKLEGPTATMAELRDRIELRERQMWEADGGRDVARGKHRRTREQRLFDAACELLLGDGAAGSGGRPAVVININGDNPDAAAEMAGVGPIPDTVAAEILARADIFVSITDVQNKNLWFGRVKRRATMTQFIALVARDKSCVLCGAHWLRCEVHHLTPWNAPAQGKTNIDELVLVCSSCHHDVHSAAQTIVPATATTWTTRPAHPHEIAPQRPNCHSERKRSPRTAPLAVVPEQADDRSEATNLRPCKKPASESSDDKAA